MIDKMSFTACLVCSISDDDDIVKILFVLCAFGFRTFFHQKCNFGLKSMHVKKSHALKLLLTPRFTPVAVSLDGTNIGRRGEDTGETAKSCFYEYGRGGHWTLERVWKQEKQKQNAFMVTWLTNAGHQMMFRYSYLAVEHWVIGWDGLFVWMWTNRPKVSPSRQFKHPKSITGTPHGITPL